MKQNSLLPKPLSMEELVVGQIVYMVPEEVAIEDEPTPEGYDTRAVIAALWSPKEMTYKAAVRLRDWKRKDENGFTAIRASRITDDPDSPECATYRTQREAILVRLVLDLDYHGEHYRHLRALAENMGVEV